MPLFGSIQADINISIMPLRATTGPAHWVVDLAGEIRFTRTFLRLEKGRFQKVPLAGSL